MDAIQVLRARGRAASPSCASHRHRAVVVGPAVLGVAAAEPAEEPIAAVDVALARLVDATETNADTALVSDANDAHVKTYASIN